MDLTDSEKKLEIEDIVYRILEAIEYNKGNHIFSCNYYFRPDDVQYIDGVITELKKNGFKDIMRSNVDGKHIVISWD